jgi:hypothetical protein
MIADLQPHVSQNVRERLARSLFDDRRDPHLVRICGQIEELAKDVRRATGAEWHADGTSHAIFIEMLKLLFADQPAPPASSASSTDPRATATFLYRRYAQSLREAEQQGYTVLKPTFITGGSND